MLIYNHLLHSADGRKNLKFLDYLRLNKTKMSIHNATYFLLSEHRHKLLMQSRPLSPIQSLVLSQASFSLFCTYLHSPSVQILIIILCIIL